MPPLFRPIQPADNASMAVILRNTLTEFGVNRPGTAYYDPATDQLFESFQLTGSNYFIVEENNRILGGGGFYPTAGLPEYYCELVKLYLHPESRGKGIGSRLIGLCMAEAKKAGYSHIYLETMPELSQAVTMYEKLGFESLPSALGNSGHFGCGIWMLKKL